VPSVSHASKAVREEQARYDGFIRQIDSGDVGDLELNPGENVRGIKVRLRRASNRLGINIEIWHVDDHVYFRREARRGRPKRVAD
jgi:hypothetical protein